ncbi:MAG: FHA domain-containing protein [Deltaproteobacteria bacterium]|nr:MAG: FHA domain-containing protein [Deltaproteobacteria bacterium]
MIRELTELGYLAVTGGPAVLKWIPKQAAGKAVLAVARHYLHAGDYLQEAMHRATAQALDAIAIGLRPQWWRRALQSRYSRNFVADFQSMYLDPFVLEFSVPTRDGFCREGSQACRYILRHLDELIEPVIPTEQAVQQFWAEAGTSRLEDQKKHAEARLIERIQALPCVSEDVLALFQFRHLLVHTIQLFFRRQILQRPEVATLLDELRSQASLDNQEGLRRDLQQLQFQIMGPLAEGVGDSFQALSEQLEGMKQALAPLQTSQEASLSRLEKLEQTMEGWATQQEHVMKHISELSGLLRSWERRENSPGWFAPLQQSLDVQRTQTLDRGLTQKERLPSSPVPFHPTSSAKAALVWVDSSGVVLRTHYLFLSPEVYVGRKSSCDLMLHWLPLPHPVSADNPEWLNWNQTRQKHPCLHISGHHFTLGWEEDSDNSLLPLLCIDESSRGTWVNGERLKKGKPTPLCHGDRIGVAEVLELRVRFLRNEESKVIGWKLLREDNAAGLEEYSCVAPFARMWVGTLPQAHVYCQTSNQEPLLFQIWHDGASLFCKVEEGDSWRGAGASEFLGTRQAYRCKSPQRWELGEHSLWIIPPG